jgi:GH43 family beta-xylosidase
VLILGNGVYHEMKSLRPVLNAISLILFVVMAMAGAVGCRRSEINVLRNPLNNSGPDPWLIFYDGNYYLSTTTAPETSSLMMRKSATLAGLKTAIPVQIYFETNSSRCCNIWAPEFHLLNGPNGLRWYFYYTAGTAGTLNNQHTHVLESMGLDPTGPYVYKSQIEDFDNKTWAIDGSVMQVDSSLYFLFSAWVGNYQSLFIAPMSNPWTISGARHLISEPEYAWEKVGLNVNEGPVALQHNGQIFIVYSASYCASPDYKLGMLTYIGQNPLEASSWIKSPTPVFQQSIRNSVFAPGHNGFFKSPDGTEDWIVYHANNSVAGACDAGRTTRVQKFVWNKNGTPNFGIPVSTSDAISAPSGDGGLDPLPEIDTQIITRFRAYSFDGAYLRHREMAVRVDFSVSPLGDSLFYVRSGLGNSLAISIESVNAPGYFLRTYLGAIVLAPNDGTIQFAGDATWWLRPGLADSSWISFESFNHPNNYIGGKFGVMALIAAADIRNNRARGDATFSPQGS